MVYLVTNVHRSGSSMMIRCLEAGGMDAAYDKSQEHLNDNRDDYIPNPNGYYALDTDFLAEDFAERFEGKVLKYPLHCIEYLPKGEYRFLFLKRNPEEIRASMEAMYPGMSTGWDGRHLDTYEEDVAAYIQSLMLKGAGVISLHYEEVVKQPEIEFQKLVDAGWPVNPMRAAQMVDPSLHRFRLERK